MRWDAFVEACPDIGALAEERFRADELVMLGTLRTDGSPRISPCELDVAEGHLCFGMMWRSKKALDLIRDPRCVVHSVTCDRMGTDGDLKLYGRMIDVHEPELRRAYRAAIKARIDWEPDEPEFHLFSLDVESAGYTIFGEGANRALAWDTDGGLRELPLA
jgi:Pyridoxamine 5'-phosphate oxidase